MALDMTSFDAALKQHYTDTLIENMVYTDNPLLAMMAKYEDFGGRNLPVVLIYGNPQGRSASFSQAQARGQVTSSRIQDFVLTRVTDYSIATIDNETLEASKGNANAFMEAATVEIDGAINSLTRSVAIAMYRSGWGDIGNVANTSFATTVLQLTSPESVTNFEVGQELVFSSAQSTAVLRDAGDSLIIVGIDRSAGTLTLSSNLSDIAGIAANDFIFIKGDRDNSATPTMRKIAGLDAWLPFVAPTSTPFFGVDRTVDVSRLAGQRLDGTAKPIEEALIDGASIAARENGKISHFFMSYAKYAELEKALGSKVQYIDLKVTADVGFRGIQINGPRGPIQVLPDANCPSNRVFGLDLSKWKLYSLGKAIRVIDTDGLQMLRQASADGVEVRYGFRGNIATNAVGYNVVIAV